MNNSRTADSCNKGQRRRHIHSIMKNYILTKYATNIIVNK